MLSKSNERRQSKHRPNTNTNNLNYQKQSVSIKRRKLKNENLELMLKSSECLLEDFVELEAQHIGRLKQISKEKDITIKSVLLNLMKDAQSQNNLPKVLTRANDSIIRINAYILELLTRDTEQMISALPVHSIRKVCYVKEAENSHIVVLQSGDAHENNDCFDLFILMFNAKQEAEVVCKLLQKCFEQLLIEKTMSLLDQAIGADELASNCSTSVSVAIRKKNHPNSNKNMYNVQNIDDVKHMISNSLSRSNRIEKAKAENRSPPTPFSSSETIDDFILKLQKELTKNEYDEFGLALAQWQKGLSFEKFCNKALGVIGTNRLHVFAAMKPFVPKENLEWFEKFIKINDSEQMFALDVYSCCYSSSTSSSEENEFSSNDLDEFKSKFYFASSSQQQPSERSKSIVKNQ